jgi:hypothetical protein
MFCDHTFPLRPFMVEASSHHGMLRDLGEPLEDRSRTSTNLKDFLPRFLVSLEIR